MIYFLKNMCVLLLLSLLIASCDNDDKKDSKCIEPSFIITSETRTVPPFHSISSTIVGDVYITQGDIQSLEIETHENILLITETEVNNSVLDISIDGCVEEMERFDVFITIPDIRSVALTGVGNVIAENPWETDELEISLVGVGNFELQGTANLLDIELMGVGDIHAFDLETLQCDIRISGVGNIEVNVVDELNIIISGEGDVYYKGDPAITTTISGTGNVINAN